MYAKVSYSRSFCNSLLLQKNKIQKTNNQQTSSRCAVERVQNSLKSVEKKSLTCMQVSPRIITGQQLTSPFNDQKVQEALTPSCSCTQTCFLPPASLVFERKVGDKPVWTDVPGVSVGLALSSLLGSLKQTANQASRPTYVPLWEKGVPVNRDQAENSGRCWLSRRELHKKPQNNTNTCTCEILLDSLPCGGWCWGLSAVRRKLMCPYECTNIPHRCNFRYSSPGSAKKTSSLPAQYHC